MPELASRYDYELPPERIAQKPASPREKARLMVLDRVKGTRLHRHVRDLPSLFKKGDVVVMNVSKVFNARLKGTLPTGGAAELFLVRPEGDGWLALGKPGRKLVPGARVEIAKGFAATVREKREDGTIIADFGRSAAEVMKLCDRHGEVPIPPYIKKLPKRGEYQTVYARHAGSVAAPTAGFHLTKRVIAAMKRKGVIFAEVTLHVGLGTFMPIRAKRLDAHKMHLEWVDVPEATARAILEAKVERRRVIAIGTTTVRALEGAAERCGGNLCAWHGDVDLFISPGFRFKAIDGMLTNFHLPMSTLIVLVSSFAGRARVLEAYRDAVAKKYRFYSFGDAMLIT